MYFTATMKANSITTYTIEGVDGIKKVPEVQPIDVEQIIVNKDRYIQCSMEQRNHKCGNKRC